jgi:DUF4097 and DUF4098 domain-containing protein YvlB
MSEFNSILTDKELRGLFQQYLLEQEEDNALTEKMIEMESKIAFGAVPVMALAVPHEAEMIGRLTKSFAAKTGLYAWTLGLGLSAVLSIGIYTWSGSGKQEKSAPVIEPKDAPVKENRVPDASPANLPVNPQNNTAYFNPPADTGGTKEKLSMEPLLSEDYTEPKKEDNRALSPVINLPVINSVLNVTAINQSNQVIDNGKRKKGEPEIAATIDTVYKDIKRIEVDAGVCNLNVNRGKSDLVTIKGQVAIEAKGIVKKPDYTIKHERRGDVLKIRVEQSGNCNVIVGSLNINAYLNVEVPAGTDVDLQNSSGDITLTGLDGRLCKVKSNYGDITAGKINTAFDFSAQSGDITIADCNGGANLQSSYGDIKIDRHKGNTEVKLASGNLTVTELTADRFEVSSSYGNVNLKDVVAPLTLKVGSGDVHLDNIKGDVAVQSTYGNQHLRSIFGNFMSVSTSGDVKIENLTGDMNIQSTYGNVNAYGCSGNILIRSQSGDIKGKNIKLHDALDLSATYGNINMQLENPMEDLSFDLMAVSGQLNVKKGGTDMNGKEGKLRLDKGKIHVKGITTSGDQVYE